MNNELITSIKYIHTKSRDGLLLKAAIELLARQKIYQDKTQDEILFEINKHARLEMSKDFENVGS